MTKNQQSGTGGSIEALVRCHDCLDLIPSSARRFAVLKKMRDIEIPADAPEPKSFFESQQYDPVIVCEDCAGWYGDHPLEVEP